MSLTKNNRGVIRIGDKTSHDGQVITVYGEMEVQGRIVARIGDLVSCPRCEGGPFKVIEGDLDVTDHGIPVAFDGHKTECGAILISSVT
ncbi:MAG: PAAR domain-containing protein [Desulfarculales bacterium]|nr:PAAR domain-containing protein [Desulfarculales bacterium]